MGKTSASESEALARVWSAMYGFVAAQDRHKELQEALGLGRGLGRVKVLVMLADGPSTLVDIAAANGFDAPYATVIVDKLASLGLVERTSHPDDLRRKLVKLTTKGHQAAKLANQIVARPPSALAALDAADLQLLDDVLARLVATRPVESRSVES